MDIIEWVEKNLNPVLCNSETFFYDEMESQSGFSLPVIYQPFDSKIDWHWGERGSIYDFLYATEGEGKNLLDFGPGDGWPSLMVAPYALHVTGVDGSRKRVEVCTKNAARLGLPNARFVHYEPGSRLPFPDESFDGVMAATSIEQSLDPKATLCELFRVLRPGGRLRVDYEALSRYRGIEENAFDLSPASGGSSWLTIYLRDLELEQARMAKVRFSLTVEELQQAFSIQGESGPWDPAKKTIVEKLRSQISEARTCTLNHPSGKTFCRWMKEIGFQQVIPTHSGKWFAFKMYYQLPEEKRPANLEDVDALLRPLVKIVVEMRAPLETDGYSADPPISAVK